MILISFSIALIAIVFGAKLLAQSQKDNLGALYKYLSWFIIAMGFCVLMCDGARGLLKIAHRGEMRREMMMNRGDDGGMGMGGGWMRHHRGDMNCCNNCCDGMNDGSCNGNMSCPDGGKGMPANCPMMSKGMKCTTDSTKK
jgi:hypothetical protein